MKLGTGAEERPYGSFYIRPDTALPPKAKLVRAEQVVHRLFHLVYDCCIPQRGEIGHGILKHN